MVLACSFPLLPALHAVPAAVPPTESYMLAYAARTALSEALVNLPFYSCVLSCLAVE